MQAVAKQKAKADSRSKKNADVWYAIGKLEGRVLMGFGILGTLNVATFVAVIVK